MCDKLTALQHHLVFKAGLAYPQLRNEVCVVQGNKLILYRKNVKKVFTLYTEGLDPTICLGALTPMTCLKVLTPTTNLRGGFDLTDLPEGLDSELPLFPPELTVWENDTERPVK